MHICLELIFFAVDVNELDCPMFCTTSNWRIVFELEQHFGYMSFPRAVMVTSREGSWQDGSKTARATCCLFCRCSPLFPRSP